MTDKSKDLKRLHSYVDTAADLVIQATDEEIEADIRARGEDPKKSAEHVRSLIHSKVTARNKKRLERAKHELANKRRNQERKERSKSLPQTPEERRELLAAILTRPDLPSELTVAFRDREDSLTDEEINSILEDFADLGLINQEYKSK